MRCRALKIDATDSLRTSSAVVHFFPVGLSDPEGEITSIGRHFHCQESPPFSAIWTSSAPSDYLRERSRIMRMWSRILSSLASPSPHSRHLCSFRQLLVLSCTYPLVSSAWSAQDIAGNGNQCPSDVSLERELNMYDYIRKNVMTRYLTLC